ncbi:MAG: FAD-dependent monooxygenase [bacterium]|nr:FAD-dependent monooxygenase [bacterium]
MSGAAARGYDVAIVGAGPVGSLCALAHARRGASVALLEANPNVSKRLAGEWLHPPALRMLEDLGIEIDSQRRSATGKGFAVFPEDRSEPIVLRYPEGSHGLVCEHEALVSRLREAVGDEPGIDFMLHARVRAVEDHSVTFSRNGVDESLRAALIVGADGRASIVRRSLGLWTSPSNCSRMMGIELSGVSLPLEGYGHVVCGGPGPILIYRLGEDAVRVIVDVPLGYSSRDLVAVMSDSYAGWMPETLRPAFLEALRARRFLAAANALRPRATYGSPRRVLIGDAAGHYHPLTAVGMTLGFGDALTLAEGKDFRDFTKRRLQATRAPELLAMGLYEVFADHRVESVALRHTIYRRWRASPGVRNRTVGLLACEDISIASLSLACGAMATRTIVGEIPRSCDQSAWRRTSEVVPALVTRLGLAFRGVRQLRRARNAGGEKDQRARETLARAFLISMPARAGALPSPPREVASPDAGPALRSASTRLVSLQGSDGAWEGEVAWCPMLTAQYVLLHHIVGRPLDADRRRAVLRYFEQSRLDGGLWGLHEHSPPHLFVTTLVYVAARLLGVEPDDPLLEPARRFLQTEGVLGIPSWGKFWLALVGLYDWRGVNAVLPDLWSLPRWTALHPSKWYCHTRLIYMAMAVIYPLRHRAPVTPVIAAVREELFPQGFANVRFSAGRNRLRDADLFARPSVLLRAGYRFARLYERFGGKGRRARCTEELIRHIRWELRTTSHRSISPVSGLLNILALWLRDPTDADCRQAFAQLDGWIWEDAEGGTRVVGARSALWDTGFSLQALATVGEFDGVAAALGGGADFVRRQQIDASFEGFGDAHRSDPKGGWCLAGKWHGWPVTDCTAEALLGLIAADGDATSTAALDDAVRFMLRGQNRDGGFGSYEAQRSAIGLEWLNPAEMFGESMTERSYVECTASCVAALAAWREQHPELTDPEVMSAISRAETWLRRSQESDGSWRGSWGVQFIYGTLFGIRGLHAAGARPGDPALRRAARWLLDRQHQDGGWGEHHSGCLTGRYVEHESSQVIQTAWAMLALLEAGDSDWASIAKGARFLLDTLDANGEWPRQDGAGVFFRTAVLDYGLYRQYFPLHALGLYEQRRQARLGLTPSVGVSGLVA